MIDIFDISLFGPLINKVSGISVSRTTCGSNSKYC